MFLQMVNVLEEGQSQPGAQLSNKTLGFMAQIGTKPPLSLKTEQNGRKFQYISYKWLEEQGSKVAHISRFQGHSFKDTLIKHTIKSIAKTTCKWAVTTKF